MSKYKRKIESDKELARALWGSSLVVFTGRIGAGKDYVAAEMSAATGATRIAYGDQLKDICAHVEMLLTSSVIGLEPSGRLEQVRGHYDDREMKERDIEVLGVGRRRFMADLAGFIRRYDDAVFAERVHHKVEAMLFDPDALIRRAKGEAPPEGPAMRRVYITDMRFRAEYESLLRHRRRDTFTTVYVGDGSDADFAKEDCGYEHRWVSAHEFDIYFVNKRK